MIRCITLVLLFAILFLGCGRKAPSCGAGAWTREGARAGWDEPAAAEEPIRPESWSQRGITSPADWWFTPRTEGDWERACGVFDCTPLVVVMASFPGEGRPTRGNGTILGGLSGWVRENAAVLTCAHLVVKGGAPASEVRVGVFAHSFESRTLSTPAYQEFRAEIAAYDEESDQALLEICYEGRLRGASRFASSEDEDCPALLCVMGGRPGVLGCDRWSQLGPGCSGAPLVLGDGGIYGMVYAFASPGKGMAGVPRYVSAGEIVTFLADALPRTRSRLR